MSVLFCLVAEDGIGVLGVDELDGEGVPEVMSPGGLQEYLLSMLESEIKSQMLGQESELDVCARIKCYELYIGSRVANCMTTSGDSLSDEQKAAIAKLLTHLTQNPTNYPPIAEPNPTEYRRVII